MREGYIKELVASTPLHIQKEVAWRLGISRKIYDALHEQGMTYKEFAEKMGKKLPEVARWVSGRHNFTIATLAKISAALNVDLLSI